MKKHLTPPTRVIGIDPDNKQHGVAIYENGKLTRLEMLDLVGVIKILQSIAVDKWVVEEVTKNNFIYGRNVQRGKSEAANAAMNAKIARNVGMNQQAMVELVRVLKAYGQNVRLVPPAKDNWSKDEQRFKRMTGWRKRSNPDKRSAAYFGFLGV
jgi:hypothetical protein